MMVQAFLFLLLNTAIAWAAIHAGQHAEGPRLRLIATGIGLGFWLLITITLLWYRSTAVLVLVGLVVGGH